MGGGSSLPGVLLSGVSVSMVLHELKCSWTGVLQSGSVGLGLREGLLASGWD